MSDTKRPTAEACQSDDEPIGGPVGRTRPQFASKGELRRAEQHLSEAFDRIKRAKNALEGGDRPRIEPGRQEDYDWNHTGALAEVRSCLSDVRDEYEQRQNGVPPRQVYDDGTESHK